MPLNFEPEPRAIEQSHEESRADMQMIYDSDAFCVVKIDLPPAQGGKPQPARGGYEIVDKLARKEIFIDGAMAASFQNDVQALIETSPSVEEIDEFLGRFSSLMHQPLALH
jgi:hypothetical protein